MQLSGHRQPAVSPRRPATRARDLEIWGASAAVIGSVRRVDTAYNDAGLPYLFTSYADTAGTIIVNQVMDIYNGLGQVTRSYQAVNGAVDTSTTPFVQYDYSDPSIGSRLIDMIYPNGRTIDYNYGDTNFGAGAVLINNNNATLDNAIGRVDAIVDGPNSGDPGIVLEQYSYLGLSTIVQAAHPQTGINLTYIQQPGQTNVISSGGDIYTGLDQFGRVIDQNWWVVATGTSTDRFQYGYDPASNVLYKNNLVNPNMSELYHANSSAPNDNGAAYDPLSRETAFARGILSASGNNPGSAALDTIANPTQSQTWNLDALGNWSGSTTNGTAQTRNFNNQNQITGISGTTATPAYDPNGNMTTDQNGNKLTYDAWNRLVQVTDPAGQVIAKYSYNAMGYRISESYPQGGNGVPAGTVKYLYYSNNWQVLETRANGTSSVDVSHQYVWSELYIDAMVLRDTYANGAIQPDARIYTQFDANYNVTALIGYNASTNAWGVVQRYVYTPYGISTVLDANWNATTDQFAWQYMHQGGRLDPITGLYDFRNRDYSPTLGNWIEQDPAGYVNGSNRYQYEVGNAPASGDPGGTNREVAIHVHVGLRTFEQYFRAIDILTSAIDTIEKPLSYVPGAQPSVGFSPFDATGTLGGVADYSNGGTLCSASLSLGADGDFGGHLGGKIGLSIVNFGFGGEFKVAISADAEAKYTYRSKSWSFGGSLTGYAQAGVYGDASLTWVRAKLFAGLRGQFAAQIKPSGQWALMASMAAVVNFSVQYNSIFDGWKTLYSDTFGFGLGKPHQLLQGSVRPLFQSAIAKLS